MSSETIWLNKATFYRKHLWKFLYKIYSFHPKWTKNHWKLLFLKYKKSSPLKLGDTMNCYFVGILYRRYFIFCADHTTNMASIGSFCLWLANLKKSSLKPFGQINWNLVRRTYGRFCIKFPQNGMIGKPTEPLVLCWELTQIIVFINLEIL